MTPAGCLLVPCLLSAPPSLSDAGAVMPCFAWSCRGAAPLRVCTACDWQQLACMPAAAARACLPRCPGCRLSCCSLAGVHRAVGSPVLRVALRWAVHWGSAGAGGGPGNACWLAGCCSVPSAGRLLAAAACLGGSGDSVHAFVRRQPCMHACCLGRAWLPAPLAAGCAGDGWLASALLRRVLPALSCACCVVCALHARPCVPAAALSRCCATGLVCCCWVAM